VFPDTIEALNDMARVMKTGARLAGLIFVKQGFPTLKMILECVGGSNFFGEKTPEALRVGEEALKALHLYDVEEIGRYLSQTGFEGFAHDIYGPFMLFQAKKG